LRLIDDGFGVREGVAMREAIGQPLPFASTGLYFAPEAPAARKPPGSRAVRVRRRRKGQFEAWIDGTWNPDDVAPVH
jgi:hypothetical protein